MANEQDNKPATGTESDISKAQAQQLPPQQARQQQGETGQRQGQFETGQQTGAELTGDQAATGQGQPGAGPDEGLAGETTTQQRTDVEGASLQPPEKGEAESGFVGAEGEQDTSSKLVEDQDFEKDGQGAPEGK